jgi:thioredoxin-like negative regulator of GroEL
MSSLAFSDKFLANRNASSSTQPSAPAVKSNVHGGGTDEFAELKQDVTQLKHQIQEIHAQMGAFGQQLATVKPNVVHAKDYDSAKFNAWLEQITQEKDAIVVVGATWCPHCNHQKEELEKLPTGTLSYVVYIDDDQKIVPALKSMGQEIEGLPTIYKTTGDGKMEEIAVGFTPADELSAHL